MKKISEMTHGEALTEQALAVFKRRLEQARKKAVESAAATKAVFDALEDMCIDPGEIPDLKELPYVAGTQSVQHDAETDSYYEVGEAGLLSVRRGYSDYMDYRFNRRSGELVLPEGRMLVMRLDEEEMWVMDHDQYELEYPTVERFRRLK